MPSGDLVTREVYEELMANTPPGVDDVREYPGRERAIAPDQDTCYLAERGPYVRRSTDRGRTWSQRYYVESVPGWDPVMPGFSAPFGLRARVIELSDGVLVFPIHSMGLPSDAGPDDFANITFVPVLVASEDGGMNWDFRGNIAPPQVGTHFNETEVIETPSGKIVAFLRPTFDDNEDMHIYTATSSDGGRTWSTAKKERVWGYPASPLKMPSGGTLLTYGYRRPDWGIRAVLVDEECTDIDDANELVVRGDGGGRDLGYPQGWLLNDGRAFVSTNFNSPGPTTANPIHLRHHPRGRMRLLFTLSRAGEFRKGLREGRPLQHRRSREGGNPGVGLHRPRGSYAKVSAKGDPLQHRRSAKAGTQGWGSIARARGATQRSPRRETLCNTVVPAKAGIQGWGSPATGNLPTSTPFDSQSRVYAKVASPVAYRIGTMWPCSPRVMKRPSGCIPIDTHRPGPTSVSHG